ncbi:ATP-binding protein [Rhodoferax mekongensis]|uniref:ATP-binding protein n=1 Tax=Rhodoferax mekongensis TaxID=3068341 RepID=UPI0028BDF75E|nr:ATP-binding protein [Rhodoferax sp. TBRC 17199]MDT7517042.1 ATP-binding protein [Rhodoferax sp. TBRC 17199]
MSAKKRYSLKSQLIASIMFAVTLTGILQAYMAFQTTVHETDELFDYQMQQVAYSLRPSVQSGNLSSSDALMDNDSDEDDEFLIQIWSSDDRRIFQSSEVLLQLQKSVDGFSEANLQGKIFKIFTLSSGDRLIQVAQESGLRQRIAGRLALRTVSPILWTMPVLLFLIWSVVSKASAPISRISSQLSNRQGNQLQELPVDGLPKEIAPLVEEVNSHYLRVQRTLESQRRFLADAAHELRSPIAALSLQLEVLNRTLENEHQDKAAQTMRLGINRAVRVVEQMLTLEHQQANLNNHRNRVIVDLCSVIHRTLTEMNEFADKKLIKLHINLTPNLQVVGDPDMLSIMIRNVIDNAIRYTPEGGVISIQLHEEQKQKTLSISDSGLGISKKYLDRVFDRFFRVPGSVGVGSGLGLSIVNEIAAFHSAIVKLENGTRSEGLTVQICFPLDEHSTSSLEPIDE